MDLHDRVAQVQQLRDKGGLLLTQSIADLLDLRVNFRHDILLVLRLLNCVQVLLGERHVLLDMLPFESLPHRVDLLLQIA